MKLKSTGFPVAPEGRKENSQGLSATARNPWLVVQPSPRTPQGCEENRNPGNQGWLASLAHPWLLSLRPSGATGITNLLRVIVLIVCSSAFVHAQTIADLARQERARRQGAPKAIVITSKDLKAKDSVPEPAPEKASTAAAAAPAAPESPVTGPVAGGHDEKWWRGQFERVRGEIQKLETQIPLLEFNFNTANREFLTRAYDPDGRGKRAIDETKAEMDTAKSDLAKAREKLAQVEEDLRRAGGPAGWTR